MSTPRSCFRCSGPIAIDSDSGLCPSCLHAGDTSGLSFVTPPAVPHPAIGSPGETRSAAVFNHPSIHAFNDTATQENEHNAHFSLTANAPSLDFRNGLPASPPGYDLLKRLGGGGMGDVFLGREQTTLRLLAIKFLRTPGNPIAVERFLAEVRALARINHPHIIKIYATIFDSLVPFFTMEFVSGGTLASLVDDNGSLDPTEAAKLIVVTARAVAAAHAVGVLHRDLKPSNILLSRDGSPRVADFGLAKRTDQDEGLTLSNSPLGTPGFMPPEQVSREYGAIGPAADTYSLGATLYYLLMGHSPFEGKTSDEITAQVLSEPPKRLRAVRPDIPLALEAIVLKCLEKKVVHRYQTPEALALALEVFLAGQVPDAPQLTFFRRSRRWFSQRRKRIAGTIGLLAVAVMIALAGWFLREQFILSAPLASDPSETILKELQAGRSVTLIGSTGPPNYSRWRLGGSAFGVSTNGEKVCYYESLGHELLELVSDPGIDRYRVTLEILQLESRQRPTTIGSSYLGPYWGYTEQATANGRPFHAYYSVTYSDILPNATEPAQPDLGIPEQFIHVVRFRSTGLSLEPHRDPNPFWKVIGKPFKFQGAGGSVGKWRTFQIDVSPEGIAIAWKDEKTGESISLRKLSGPEAIAQFAHIQKRVNEAEPGTAIVLPEWSPRMPLGIWSHGCAVGLRNVVITPLPSSQ